MGSIAEKLEEQAQETALFIGGYLHQQKESLKENGFNQWLQSNEKDLGFSAKEAKLYLDFFSKQTL